MSYAASAALQTAIFQYLRDDDALTELVGDAVFDAMPASAPAGLYVALGPEDVREVGDISGAGTRHDLIVSVMSGADAGAGFGLVKQAAAAVSDRLDGAQLPLSRGRLVGIWFQRATARRIDNGTGRRVDLTFRARVDLA
ncbi:MAG: DUF3168 domain-containing protein [Paracoccus sp. (in: a-proteobacteria)]|nr:DUF3168 domain-containing protein [Paracoccus sp. (in: a-proteobacteria)]